MPEVEEKIPEALASEVEAARSCINRERGTDFRVTGIIDPESAIAASQRAHELQLILCGHDGEQDVCLRERFSMRPISGGFDVDLLGQPSPESETIPKLDPPPGARSHWIDSVLAKHSFVLLVFYRGFW